LLLEAVPAFLHSLFERAALNMKHRNRRKRAPLSVRTLEKVRKARDKARGLGEKQGAWGEDLSCEGGFRGTLSLPRRGHLVKKTARPQTVVSAGCKGADETLDRRNKSRSFAGSL